MIHFIDNHREEYGVEPICRVLPIAPSTYHKHDGKRPDPARRSERAQQDGRLSEEIRRVFTQNFGAYGARKAWRQLLREGFAVARFTVERFMRKMGLQGVVRGKAARTTISGQGFALSAGSRQPPVSSGGPKPALGVRLYLCGHLVRL